MQLTGRRLRDGAETLWGVEVPSGLRGLSFMTWLIAPTFLTVFGFALFGFGSVEIAEYGLLENLLTRKVETEPYSSGRYWIGPWSRFIKFPAVVKTIQFSDEKLQTDLEEQGDPMLRSRTKDGLDVLIELSFQYQLNATDLFVLYTTLGSVSEFHKTFVRIAIDRLTEIATNYTANEFFIDRTRIGKDMEHKLKGDFEHQLYATIFSFQLRSVGLPKSFEEGIQKTEVQKQDVHVAEAEQQSTRVALETALMQAQRRVNVRANEGEAYGKSVMLANSADIQQFVAMQEKTADSYSGVLKALDSKESNFLSYVEQRALRDHPSDKTTLGLKLPTVSSQP
jgi:hypothetical protein